MSILNLNTPLPSFISYLSVFSAHFFCVNVKLKWYNSKCNNNKLLLLSFLKQRIVTTDFCGYKLKVLSLNVFFFSADCALLLFKNYLFLQKICAQICLSALVSSFVKKCVCKASLRETWGWGKSLWPRKEAKLIRILLLENFWSFQYVQLSLDVFFSVLRGGVLFDFHNFFQCSVNRQKLLLCVGVCSLCFCVCSTI